MENKLISIITPSYNCVEKMDRTIKSILSQDRSLFEFIIIDGGSTDGTLEIIQKYKEYIRFISEKDSGIYDAMNKGIDLAAGKYLYFIGAGDTLKENILSIIKDELPKEKFYFVYGNVYMHDSNRLYGGKFNRSKIRKANICHQAIFYERHIFELIGKYSLDYKVFSDYLFNIKCFAQDEIIKKYINATIADYEGFGVSSQGERDFKKDLPYIIKDNLGYLQFVLYKITKIIFCMYALIRKLLGWVKRRYL